MERRISLVTGGTGGLGQGVVHALLERGDEVFVPWIDAGERTRFEATSAELDRVHLVEADVTDAARLDALRARIEREHGRLDVLCNLVGGFTMAELSDTADADWDRMLRLNADTAFRVTRATIDLLRTSGRGRVLNVTSATAVRAGGGGMAAYAAAKGAVAALTHALAEELADDGITVNAIAPTVIDTPANRAAMPGADRSRWVTPAEIGALMAFLSGDQARVVTGNCIVVGR